MLESNIFHKAIAFFKSGDRSFGDKSPKTALLSSRVNLLQQRNDLEDLKQTIAIEVTDRIRDVNSNFAEVREARQATKLAQERLNIVRELYRRGRDGIDIFEVTSQQDEVVEAQNTELNAVIDYLNAWTDLEQSSGTTLNTWRKSLYGRPDSNRREKRKTSAGIDEENIVLP